MGYFRFGVRDLLWGMALLGLSLGWWLDHRQNAEAKDDAHRLAHYGTAPRMCGMTWAAYQDLLEKYGASQDHPIVILEEDESKLGIELQE